MSTEQQQIFTRVKEHLLTQNVQCKSGRGCAYRNDEGQTCAVGCLITEEHYCPSIEGADATSTLVKDAVEKSLGIDELEEETVSLLRKLQIMHDEEFPYKWPEHLQHIATEYSLQYEQKERAT